jgi:hypothetical protein
VSLAEAPENEIPIAKELVDYVAARACHRHIQAVMYDGFDYEEPVRRTTSAFGVIGGDNVPVVVGCETEDKDIAADIAADLVPVVSLDNAKDNMFIAVTYDELTAVNVEKLKPRIFDFSSNPDGNGEFADFAEIVGTGRCETHYTDYLQ